MNRDDIARLAEENGIVIVGEAMFRFAALVAAHEREECAKACEGVVSGWVGDTWVPSSARCAAFIRARGEK